jgi:DNA replication protein DnaC
MSAVLAIAERIALMLEQNITQHLGALSLSGMVSAIAPQTTNSAVADLPFLDRLGHVITAEEDWCADRKRERLLKAAKLRTNAQPEDILFGADRGLERSYVAELLTSQWVRQGETLVITGPTGTGKIWLACTFGTAAARAGHALLYHRCNALLEEMSFAHADGSIKKLEASIAKAQLLILDDFALAPIDERAKEDLLALLENRTGERATLIAGQRAYTEWHGYIDNPLLADAIMNRLVQRSHKTRLKGDSMRK